MATLQGVDLADVLVDAGESAKSLQRPAMGRLLELVDARAVQVVIIAKLDRLTRSVRDLGDLLERFQRRGVALVSVAESLDTSSAAGRLVINVMGAVSQWEREAIGERTRDALRHKRATGRAWNHAPYGWRLEDGQLVAEPAEQDAITAMRGWQTEGASLRAIAARLNAQGVATKKGGQWQAKQVADVLRLNAAPVAA
jgi:site-specific DNA recombinase